MAIATATVMLSLSCKSHAMASHGDKAKEGLMDSNVHTRPLTTLERMDVREALQDRWREQMRLITLLTLQLEVAESEAGSAGTWLDTTATELAIHRARVRLASIEQAMRRLDGGTRRDEEPLALSS
jgi:hypothetical protein